MEYYSQYENHFDLRVHRPVTVSAVFNRGADLIVRSDAGDIATHAVVNATGTWGAPFVPYYRGALEFRGRQVHTATYRSAEDFRGQRVLVVRAAGRDAGRPRGLGLRQARRRGRRVRAGGSTWRCCAGW